VNLETRQKLTINSENIFHALMTGVRDGIIVSDQDGRILLCNDAVTSLVGGREEELIGQPLTNIVLLERSGGEPGHYISDGTDHATTDDGASNRRQDQPTADNHDQSPSTNVFGQEMPNHGTVFCRTGMALSMPISHLPILDDSGLAAGHLTVIYIVQASSVQQAQTEFVSTVSHELRTPLTSIKGFADTILRAGDRLDLAQQRRYVGIIKDQADRLTRLVEDLLSVSRLESKKMQLIIRAIDLAEMVQRVLRNLSDKAGEHRIITNIPAGLAQVWADGDRLEQILTNLIDNAIKYSPQHTTVTVSAREINAHPALVEFSVSDQGVGIESEHLPQIFTKFARIDNPLVRQTEGTGLGLYITRSLVIALGGEISVESVPGHTTFTVKLPAASLEEQAARGRD
jgi:two-component system phosphate regulon sensor histidine kinase PhoR